MMNRKKSFVLALLLMLLLSVAAPVAAFAADAAAPEAAAQEQTDAAVSSKAYGSGISIGLAAAGGAIAMSIAVGKSAEGISRQPEAAGEIRSSMMLGLVFIETAIIYALLVVILLIFVL